MGPAYSDFSFPYMSCLASACATLVDCSLDSSRVSSEKLGFVNIDPFAERVQAYSIVLDIRTLAATFRKNILQCSLAQARPATCRQHQALQTNLPCELQSRRNAGLDGLSRWY